MDAAPLHRLARQQVTQRLDLLVQLGQRAGQRRVAGMAGPGQIELAQAADVGAHVAPRQGGGDDLFVIAQFGHQRRQIVHLGDLADAIGLQLRAQQIEMAYLCFGIERYPESLALHMRHQAAQLQQPQRFPDGAAAGAETLLQFLFPQGLPGPDSAVHYQFTNLFL